MKILPVILITAISLTLLWAQGCTKDVIVSSDDCTETESVTYGDVRQILNSSCGAGSTNCHVPGGTKPDYTSFNDDMQASLTFERFESQVLITMAMPQSPVPPLDSIDRRKIKCWVENDYAQ